MNMLSEERRKIEYSEEFESFWKKYPHPKWKGSKTTAWKKWKLLTEQDKEEIMAALPAYESFIFENAWYHAMQAQRFCNGEKRNWDGYTDSVLPGEPPLDEEHREQAEENRRKKREREEQNWKERYYQLTGKRVT